VGSQIDHISECSIDAEKPQIKYPLFMESVRRMLVMRAYTSYDVIASVHAPHENDGGVL